MPQKWTSEQRQLLIWLNLSPRERVHKSERELAEYLNVHYNSLCNWKKLPGWNDAVQKAGWYVVEQTNHLALQKSRELALTSDNLKDQADYYRWIYPLVAQARNHGYFDEFEPSKEGTAFLPEETVLRELSKYPIDQQKNFEELLHTLEYLKNDQAIVENDAKDVLSDLIVPLENQPTIYRNTLKRKNSRTMRQLPAPTKPAPIKRTRKYAPSASTKTIEL